MFDRYSDDVDPDIFRAGNDIMEVISVTKFPRLSALAIITAFAIGLVTAPVAEAQKKPDAPAATPATTAKPKTAAKKVASPCKGLEKTACSKMADTCSWIDATTRKDGKKVKAYCRKRPAANKATNAKPAKKTTAKAKAPPAPAN